MTVWCRRIILSFFFVHCKRDLWSALPAKNPDVRPVWRHATRDGELRQTGSKIFCGLIWGVLLAMRPIDRELGKTDMRNIHVTMYIYICISSEFALAQCAHRFVTECRLEFFTHIHTQTFTLA